MELAAIIISGISLLVAILSFILSLPTQRLQNKINQLEVKLKEYELAEVEKENKKSACVEGRVIKIGKGKYRLKVWNSGNATAKNVTASFNKGSNIIMMDSEKMPFEELEPQKNFEIVLVIHNGSSRKFTITTTWEDGSGIEHCKTQYGDM